MEVLKKRKVDTYRSCPTAEEPPPSPVHDAQMTCSPEPVLSKDVTAVDFVEVYAAEILDTKTTSRIIRDLRSIFPLTSLPHIKRVRKTPASEQNPDGHLEIVLCEVADVETTGSPLTISDIFRNKPGVCLEELGQPFVAKVSKMAPVTRQQFEVASTEWPVVFHQNKQLSQVVSGQLFTKEDKVRIAGQMLKAVKAAKAALSQGMTPIGAVIVDPASDTVQASCYDLRKSSPLQHAVMVCVDLVARSQGGGAWEVKAPGHYYLGQTTHRHVASSSSPPATEDQSANTDRGETGVRLAIDNSVCETKPSTILEPRPVSESSDGPNEPHDGRTDHQPVTSPSSVKDGSMADVMAQTGKHKTETGSSSSSASSKAQGPYLCTGYDLYVTQEPCVMCAMALVHSRIRRVFYGASHKDGALGSRFMVHCQPGLNHHFDVFRNVLTDECRQLNDWQS